ncbi:YveK family protein [Cohnella fermenti]|uniref:Lipopolysaccharide biosynthesis protein n=1 Tax=Cohnella fermenti TaxID=2565925 RepID=A0A4S4BJQ4_9BACL|nr:Wzz/FepE/Etk N-terminal domain-containing protein [Cohnella fermenti]THF74915.1 lipopolysaccharide biosynthesis protein [Cohnella fermenti]
MEIKQYMKLLKKRLWLILLCVAISMATTTYLSYENYQPLYQASTKLIVNKTEQDQQGSETMDLAAINVNIGLVETYKEIIMTPAILGVVVDRYPELNLTEDELGSRIAISNYNGTQVMTIQTTDNTYERAADIVNAVAQVVKTEIPRIMKVNNVELLNTADPNETPPPINQDINQKIAISFAVSLLFAVGITFLLEFLDDTLKTKKDIRNVMNLPTLTTIPTIRRKAMRAKKKTSQKQVGETKYAPVQQ